MVDPIFQENHILNRNFTVDEVNEIVIKCKNGTSTGIDCICYEILKCRGNKGADSPVPVMSRLW